jgi:hypothetical protein
MESKTERIAKQIASLAETLPESIGKLSGRHAVCGAENLYTIREAIDAIINSHGESDLDRLADCGALLEVPEDPDLAPLNRADFAGISKKINTALGSIRTALDAVFKTAVDGYEAADTERDAEHDAEEEAKGTSAELDTIRDLALELIDDEQRADPCEVPQSEVYRDILSGPVRDRQIDMGSVVEHYAATIARFKGCTPAAVSTGKPRRRRAA